MVQAWQIVGESFFDPSFGGANWVRAAPRSCAPREGGVLARLALACRGRHDIGTDRTAHGSLANTLHGLTLAPQLLCVAPRLAPLPSDGGAPHAHAGGVHQPRRGGRLQGDHRHAVRPARPLHAPAAARRVPRLHGLQQRRAAGRRHAHRQRARGGPPGAHGLGGAAVRGDPGAQARSTCARRLGGAWQRHCVLLLTPPPLPPLPASSSWLRSRALPPSAPASSPATC